MNPLRVGGIVLCGGQSSRMGFRPKAWLPFGNELMLPRVVRILSEVVQPIVVVAAQGQELPELPNDVQILYDPVNYQGPLQGLAIGLEALQNRVDAVYISGCDVPFLHAQWVRYIIDQLGNATICAPQLQGFVHPLAAVYRVSVLPRVQRLIAENRRRPLFLIQEENSHLLTEAELLSVDPQLKAIRNLNTPEEYEQALRELQN